MKKRTKLKPDDVIRTEAYLLWERSGKPQGRDVEFWLIAEQELKNNIANGGIKITSESEHTIVCKD